MFELLFKCFLLPNKQNKIITKSTSKITSHLTSKQVRRLKRRSKYITST